MTKRANGLRHRLRTKAALASQLAFFGASRLIFHLPRAEHVITIGIVLTGRRRVLGIHGATRNKTAEKHGDHGDQPTKLLYHL